MLADKRVRPRLAEVSAGVTDQGRPALDELPGLYQPGGTSLLVQGHSRSERSPNTRGA